MIPYYNDGTCVIYHGDCQKIIPTLEPVDLVVTSPPYNLGMHPSGTGSGMHAGSGYTANGKTWNRVADLAGGYGDDCDDAMRQDEYDAWQTEVVDLCWRQLSNEGAIFYNHKPRPMNGVLHLPIRYGDAINTRTQLRGALPLRQIIVWDRGVGMNFSESFFLPKSEWIVVWARPEWRLKDRRASGIGDVWRFPPESATGHPAPFPLELPTRIIDATSAAIVLDPFMGSGTTLRAAKDLGRKAIGIEIEERYCEIAAKRLAQEVLDFGTGETR